MAIQLERNVPVFAIIFGVVLGVGIMSACGSIAYAQSIQSLKVNLYLYSASGSPTNVLAWVKFKGITLTKTLNFKAYGTKYVLATFLFPPKARTWLDWYDTCVKNLRTSEVHCETEVWWGNANPSINYLSIFNTR